MRFYHLLKTIFTLGLLAVVSISKAQDLPLDKETGLIHFTEVVRLDSTSKEAIYTRARLWFAETFKSANNVLQMDDRQAGILSGKAYTELLVKGVGGSIPVQMWFNIKIEIKDGRYKYSITDIRYQDAISGYNPGRSAEEVIITNLNKPNGKPRILNEGYKIETVASINILVNSIKNSLAKPSTVPSSNNDW